MSHSRLVPQHIAIIMDGNRRWARQHKMEAFKGHEYVANKVIEELTEACVKRGIKYLTLWAFSTENWKREAAEVDGLMNLFRKSFSNNAQKLHERGVRLHTIGDISKFPDDIRENIHRWIEDSKENTAITVTFALNYGGRDEILRAINALRHDSSVMDHQSISEGDFTRNLDTKGLPDPDLIIRPGGEKRLSGYLPWQSVYSELYFTDVLMPDFNTEQLDIALEDFAQRQRRFGK